MSVDVEVGSILDLSCRTIDEDTDDYDDDTHDLYKKTPETDVTNKVSSPMLMPPPIKIPAGKGIPKVAPAKVFNPKIPSKHVQETSPGIAPVGTFRAIDTNTCLIEEKNLTSDNNIKKVRCSVPTNDVRCFVTNNIGEVDLCTKKLVYYQINRKIYSRPPVPNTRLTPRRCAGQFGIDVTKSIRKSMKINKKHFMQKKLEH